MERRLKPVLLKETIDDFHKLQPLPEPQGHWPYHLDISEIEEAAICDEFMEFHMVGDTGSMTNPEFQRKVADAMASQIPADGDERPAFLLHMGDVVYNHGEACEYAAQFFQPFEYYPAPIFAIAGNHDSDVNPESAISYKSLDAFRTVFCSEQRSPVAFSNGSSRLSMLQPHVYWTLRTPLADFICLYGNATKFGCVTDEQFSWFIHELKRVEKERATKALIVCIHHAPYSADTNHGSSPHMINMLEKAFAVTGVLPDLVCSGHVHNYQRFSKHYGDGAIVRYVVAGAGGYADLHAVAQRGDMRVYDDNKLFGNIHLENYCDNRHGFLKMKIRRNAEGLMLTGEYYTIAGSQDHPQAELFERFNVPLRYDEVALMA